MSKKIVSDKAITILSELEGLPCYVCHEVLAQVGYALNSKFEKSILSWSDNELPELIEKQLRGYDFSELGISPVRGKINT